MVAATFTAIIIDKFQELGNYQTFGLSALFLVPIIPVITDTSGNAGGQASSSVIIAIAHGEVTPKEYRKVFWKELKVSLVIGMFLALLNFARLLVYYLAFDPKDAINRIVESNNIDLIVGQDQYIIFSTIVALGSSLSIFISVILSKILGGLLPVIAVKFRVDPAAMSNPVLTTILDTASMVVFFGIGVSVISAFVK
jgi:magnesium transporter